MIHVQQADQRFVCSPATSVCYQEFIVMNENVVRICHLSNLYEIPSYSVCWRSVKEIAPEKRLERSILEETHTPRANKWKGYVSLSKCIQGLARTFEIPLYLHR